jgi:hypothetical protein
VCCRFESRSSRRAGILASDMAYGVVRQGFDPGFQGFPLSAVGSAHQLRLRPALVYKVGCTRVTLYAPKWVNDCHSIRRWNGNSLGVSFIIFRFHNTIDLGDYYYY